MLVRQVLYPLNHLTSPSLSGFVNLSSTISLRGQNGTMSHSGSPGHLMLLTNKVQTRQSRLPVSAPLCVYKGLFHHLGSFLTSFTFMPGPSEFSPRRCWGQGRVLASEAAAHWSGRLLLSGSQRHGFFSKGQALGRD